jgi:hypothetical protein
MFCPQCGQQSSDEIRFCPKCGLSLVPHAALIATGNTAADAQGAARVPARPAKRVGSRRGAKLMFFAAVLFPVFLLLSLAVDEPVPLFVPILMFMSGLAWWAYVRLFGEDPAHAARQTSRRDLKAGGEQPALNAQQYVPASLFDRQRANTAEIVQPPSVTEHTTKLLDQDS